MGVSLIVTEAKNMPSNIVLKIRVKPGSQTQAGKKRRVIDLGSDLSAR